MSFTGTEAASNWGITTQPNNQIKFFSYAVSGSGYTAAQLPINVTFSGGGGTGAAAQATTFEYHIGATAYYGINGYVVTSSGSGYTSAPNATVPAPLGPSGSNPVTGQALAYIDLNTNNVTNGQLVAVIPAGPMTFAAGRQYTGCFQNSSTGQNSDIAYQNLWTCQPALLPPSSQPYVWAPLNPSTGPFAAPGWQSIFVSIDLGTTTLGTLDPQIDYLIVLATSDGGSLETLYVDANWLLSSFVVTSAYGTNLTLQYFDNIPDTYTDGTTSEATLLDANLFVQPDGQGGTLGVAGNTPPPTNLYYPVAHQGRLFATDGKTVFYSKSIDEVTTTTGLITAKWEECWPGDYQLPIALDNEVITAMKSDGQILHVGTDKALYSVYGTSPYNFSVPANQFSQTGILTNDLFTVVYTEGQPAGFCWVTPDFKVLWSDFNTYEDIGIPIYPLLSQWNLSFTEGAKLSSLTYGPYNFVFLCYADQSSNTHFLLFETRLRTWYRWQVATTTGETTLTGPKLSFSYQSPVTGNRNLYYWQSAPVTFPPTPWASGNTSYLIKFDPTQITDYLDSAGIGWLVTTNWQTLGDSFAFKVLNEVELISDDVATVALVISGANTQAEFDSPFSIPSAAFVQGPLGTWKAYLAGNNTSAKYYQFSLSSAVGSSVEALTAFQIEVYPMARI